MIRPIWAIAGVALLGTAGVAGAILVASSGGEEEVVQQIETATGTASPTPSSQPAASSAAPEVTSLGTAKSTPSICVTPTPFDGPVIWRWADVTLSFTPGTGVIPRNTQVGPDEKPPDGGPAIEIIRSLPGIDPSNAFVDAETGAILVENIRPEDRATMDAVLRTVTVDPIDRSNATWPFNGEPPAALKKSRSGDFGFVEPAPSSGFHVSEGLAEPGSPFIRLESVGSAAHVSLDEAGNLSVEMSPGSEEDRPILDRWVAEVKRLDAAAQC